VGDLANRIQTSNLVDRKFWKKKTKGKKNIPASINQILELMASEIFWRIETMNALMVLRFYSDVGKSLVHWICLWARVSGRRFTVAENIQIHFIIYLPPSIHLSSAGVPRTHSSPVRLRLPLCLRASRPEPVLLSRAAARIPRDSAFRC
jgi:hypothetical protein